MCHFAANATGGQPVTGRRPAGVPANGGPLPGLVGFTAALRHAGLPITTDRVAAFLSALDQLDMPSRAQTYWAGRLTLCADPDDLGRYGAAFDAWFASRRARPEQGLNERPPTPSRLAALRHSGTDPDEDTSRQSRPRMAASAEEVLRNRDPAELTPAECAHLRALLALLRTRPPLRISRRRRPARRGYPDPGRTLRDALRNHGELRGLPRRAPGRRPRRVVLLIDVFGSMTPYADTLMRFAHVVVRRMPTDASGAEVFTVGTRLTRVTRELRHRDALAEQLARLRLLSHRMIWVNPHAGKAGYAPVQSGIVAALPHVDELLAGHSLATLERLLEVMADA